MPCNIVIMKQMSSPTAGSVQAQSSLQGPKVSTEFLIPQAINPKTRTGLSQSEGRSELLPPLPQRNRTTETKKHPGAANSHHEPWPPAPSFHSATLGGGQAGFSLWGITGKGGSG